MPAKFEKAVFAAGCFWCTEAVFKRLRGVASVISGYANSKMDKPTYEDVSTGETGAAEAIQVTFDPSVISYKKLLEVFWSTHDPTQLNKQGADTGTQYRSSIFYMNDEQKKIATESKNKMSDEMNVMTEVVPLKKFYTAEDYHQDYYEKHKHTNPYCPMVIAPKIRKLMQNFKPDIKEEYK